MNQNERMRILARGLGLFLAVVLPLAVMPGNSSRLAGMGEAYAQTGVPFGIYMPPAHKVCEFNSVFVLRKDLLSDNLFDPALLDIAQACGTKVVVRLHGLTRDITGDSGGLDLAKFEDRINDFAGFIDPYVEDGTIIAHLTIDEPHHCFDWLDVCPTPSEVDQAAQISKSYWPGLPTVVNTLPVYASAYDWVHTDVMNFQYAYHRGSLDIFIFRALGTLNNGHVGELSWSMQALEGGCTIFGDCPMTPAQVEEVGTAMCDTGTGFTLGFFKYDEDLVDEAMQQSINYLRVYCADMVGYPPYAVPGPDQTVNDADCNGFESVTLDGSASYDQDGSIVAYEWKEGETVLGNAAVLTHDFAVGYHPLILTVTDKDGLISANDVTVIVQESIKTVEFFHSFEADEWGGLWEEDAQDDWQRTDRRAAGGVYSAEVDGFARDATLSMVSAVDLSGKSRARLFYSWGIRSGWRKGEYIALDFHDGVEWQEVKRLRADVDPEDVWLDESIELAGYLVADFKVRFRATVRFPTRDGYVDSVKIVSCAVPVHQSPAADAGPDRTAIDEDGDGVERVSLMGSGPTGPRPLSSALP